MSKNKTIDHIKRLVDKQDEQYEPLTETRVFDNLPDLLDDEKLNEASQRFLKIINDINAVEKSDSGFKLLKIRDKDAVTQFCKYYLRKGCEELLDKFCNNVDSRLIKIMRLPKDTLASDMVYAYYSSVNQSITKRIYNKINNVNENKYHAVTAYLSAESNKWVNETIAGTRRTRLLMTGATGIVTIATGAFLMFSTFSDKNEITPPIFKNAL